MSNNRYTRRSLAQVVLEAISPLAIGSGEKGITTDSEVAVDINGLPYIPGSSLKGVIRHALEAKPVDGVEWNDVFGFQARNKGQGAQLIVSDGLLLDKNGKPVDEIVDIGADDFLKNYTAMPVRQHVRIGHKGSAQKGGKFDNMVAYAGSRFCFEIEQCLRPGDADVVSLVLKALSALSFRIGGGTRKGYGQIKVVSFKTKSIDLLDPEGRNEYLSKSSSLASNWWDKLPNQVSNDRPTNCPQNDQDADYDIYHLSLHPDDFFLFGSGSGDESGDADIAPVFEKRVDWSHETASLVEKCILIPASSVKGALAHRTAFHHNKRLNRYVDDNSALAADSNEAVLHLFGGTEGDSLKRGNVLLSDVFGKANPQTKLINHVSIDRFTGGAIDGALFSEQAVFGKGDSYELDILVYKAPDIEPQHLLAFEDALKDLVAGMLPLGGGASRGNGFFSGNVTKNGKQI